MLRTIEAPLAVPTVSHAPRLTDLARSESVAVAERDVLDAANYLINAIDRLERLQMHLDAPVDAALVHLARARHETEKATAVLMPTFRAASEVIERECCVNGEIPF